MAYRIEATTEASDTLAAKPKLRQRVEEMLTGILETAEELRRTGQGTFSGTSEQPMRVHVGDFVIWYVLDLDGHSARILLIDRAVAIPKESSSVS
jgi:mRNA-degrading endonuclease RelE of RelBE toxin-antitoxin system